MKLGKRSILSMLGAALAVTALIVATAWNLAGSGRANSTGSPAVSADSKPALTGEMGDFSYFASPKPVPPIAFLDGAGTALTLADFKGRVVLVNFWATWCGPCVSEMPALDRLQAKLGGPDFTVLDLSLDREGRGAVEPYFAQNKLGHLKIYLDPKGQAFHAWNGQGVPTSFLIGRDGKARGMMLGAANWDSPAALALIRQLIDAGSGTEKLKATQNGATPRPAAAPG